MPPSIGLTALSKPGGSAGGTVVVVGASGGRVLVAEGGEAAAVVADAGEPAVVVVVVGVGGATVVSDATPRAAEGGGVRDAVSSAWEQPPIAASPPKPNAIQRCKPPTLCGLRIWRDPGPCHATRH